MRTIKMTIIAAAALTLAGAAIPAFADAPAAAAATSAMPQSYAFVDMIRIMHESSAAKAVNDELTAKKAALKVDFENKGKSLNEEGKALNGQRATLTKEAFEAKAHALEDKFSQLSKTINERKQNFDAVAGQSMSKVRDLAGDYIETVAQTHKYTAVFSREAVIIGAKELDMTDEVIKLMNAGGKKVAIDWSAKVKKPGLVVDDGQ